MTIQPIGAASVALYFTGVDLAVHGSTPAGLTLAQALTLTRQACAQAGIPLRGSVEIEAYPERSGVLIFAHVSPSAKQWFTFDDIEGVLSTALALCRRDPDAALWWYEGRYWLALPGEDQGAGAVCAEFGAPQPDAPLLHARLEEAGQAIYPHHALSALARHFLRLQL